MKPQSLMKRKSAYTKRRLIFALIISTILTVAIMTGFGASIHTDNHIYTAEGSRVVMWKELPESGTPSDYDLLTNVQYTAQRIYTTPYFRGETRGKVTASAFGIPYVQNVNNTRVVKGGKIFSEAISTSALVSVGEQKYFDGNAILFRAATDINGNSAVYADNVTKMSKQSFYDNYGVKPNELTKEAILLDDPETEENECTILSVRDENASLRSAASTSLPKNSDEGGGIVFETPQALVADSNGNYRITLELDPYKSTIYSRNEVRTLAGSSKNPLFYEVTVTFLIDSNWNPISTTTHEVYDIELGIGVITCTSSLTETFSDIGNENGVLPEEEYYSSHVDNAVEGDIGGNSKPTPVDYLTAAFGDYISGAKTLDLSADIAIKDVKSLGDIDIKGLKLSVNIDTLNIKARYDRLYIEYKDDRIYITLNNIKGYIPLASVTELMQDETIKGLTSGITMPDLGSLFGGDILSKVFADCTMETTSGITRMHLPFALSDDIAIDASLYIKDDGMELQSIEGTITAFGMKIELSAEPATNLRFPNITAAYKDLSPALDFIPAAVTTALGKTYGIDGTIDMSGETVGGDYSIGVNAYIDRTDGITADAAISALGTDIGIKYVDDTLYASLFGLGVKAGSADIPALIDTISELLPLDTSMLDDLKKMLPDSIGGWIGVLQSIEVSDDTLVIGARLIGIPITLTLEKESGALTRLALAVNANILDIKLDATVDLAISAPEPHTVTADGSYIDAKEITALIPYITEYVNADGLTLKLDGNLTVGDYGVALDGFTASIDPDDLASSAVSGKISALGHTLGISYVDGTAYIGIDGTPLKARFGIDDINALSDKIGNILNAAGIQMGADISISQIVSAIDSITGAIDALTVKDGVITLSATVDGETVTVNIDLKAGTLNVDGSICGVTADIDASIAVGSTTVTAPADAEEYIDLAAFGGAIDTLAAIAKEKSASAAIAVNYGKYEITGDLYIDLSDGIAARLTVPATEIYGASVSLDVSIINNTLYLAIGGNYSIALTCSVDDAADMVSALSGVIPQDILDRINAILDMLGSVCAGDITAIGSLIPQGGANIDIPSAINSALGAISALAVNDGTLKLTLDLAELGIDPISVTAATDLTSISVDTAVGGNALSAAITNIAAGATVTAASADYVSVAKFKPMISAVLPLIGAEGFELGIDAEVYGVAVTGTVKLALPTETQGLAVSATVLFGDVDIDVVYTDNTVYLSIGDIKVKCGTSKAEIESLINTVKTAIPQLGELLDGNALDMSAFTDIVNDPASLAKAMLALENTASGLALNVDLSPVLGGTARLRIDIADGLEGISVAADISGIGDIKALEIFADTDVTVTGGAITSIALTNLTVNGTTYAKAARGESDEIAPIVCGAVISLAPTGRPTISATGEYIDVAELAALLSPVMNFVDPILSASPQALEFELSASITTAKNVKTTVTGKIAVNFDPIAVDATITLFADDPGDEVQLSVKFVGTTLYLAVIGQVASTDENGDPVTVLDESIKLSFDINSDKTRLINLVKGYCDKGILPNYFIENTGELLNMLFDMMPDTGATGEIGLLMNRFTEIAKADSAEQAVGLLTSALSETNGNSALKAALGMIGLGHSDSGELAIRLTPIDSLSLLVVPTIADGALTGATVSGSFDGTSLDITVKKPAILTYPENIAAPDNADTYISVVDIIEVVNNFISNFTTGQAVEGAPALKDVITFSISEFGFTLTEPIYTGKEITGTKTISISNGSLKGKFQKKAGGGYDISLEAHVDLDISTIASTFGTIKLALYVANGEAFLDYSENTKDKEGKDVCIGERISIDYASVMEILAAAMQIMSVDPDIIDALVGDYTTGIETSLFDSMDIEALGSIKTKIEEIAGRVNGAMLALADIGKAWELVHKADSATDPIEALKKSLDDTLAPDGETVTELGIKSLIKSALANLGIKINLNQNTPKGTGVETVYDGSAVKNILGAISLSKSGDNISASVDNALTTNKVQTGIAKIDVMQGKNADGVMLINGIKIANLGIGQSTLDVDATFTAGGAVDITIPEKDKTNTATSTYSNLSNIKHLLFDVLNTANMMEFEIGETSSTDYGSINLNLALGDLDLKNCTIRYNIKVKLIEQPEGSEVPFKTAAYVELIFKDCKAGTTVVLPDCTTRLMFYDNNFYINGCEWYSTKVLFVTTWHTRNVNVHYTMDELKAMSTDELLYKFLFYVFPLSRDCLWQDLQSTIVNAATGGSSDNTKNDKLTIARIFKGYTYNVTEITPTAEEGTPTEPIAEEAAPTEEKVKIGTHELIVGLAELAGSDMLGDLTLDIVGANDGDTYLSDNYISDLTVSTKMTKVVNIQLDLTAKLKNASIVNDQNGKHVLKSTGLTNTTINIAGHDVKYDFDNLFFDVTDDQGTVTKQSYINSVTWG